MSSCSLPGLLITSFRYRNGGTRGGAAQFQWDKVRGDDSYLGASVNAPRVGRRDLDRDWFWYTKSTDVLGRRLGEPAEVAQARRRLEILERKQADNEALADALGETAESRARRSQADSEIAELRKFLERGGTERDHLDTERKAGLGAAPAKRHEHVVHDTRVAIEAERQERERRQRDLLVADAARRRALDPATLEQQQAVDQRTEHIFVRDSSDTVEKHTGKRARTDSLDEKRKLKKLRKKLKKEKKKRKKQDGPPARHDSDGSD